MGQSLTLCYGKSADLGVLKRFIKFYTEALIQPSYT